MSGLLAFYIALFISRPILLLCLPDRVCGPGGRLIDTTDYTSLLDFFIIEDKDMLRAAGRRRAARRARRGKD